MADILSTLTPAAPDASPEKKAAVKRALVKKALVRRAVKKALVKKAVKRKAVKKAVVKRAVKKAAVKKAVKRRAVKKAVVKKAVKRGAVKKAVVKKAVKRKRPSRRPWSSGPSRRPWSRRPSRRPWQEGRQEGRGQADRQEVVPPRLKVRHITAAEINRRRYPRRLFSFAGAAGEAPARKLRGAPFLSVSGLRFAPAGLRRAAAVSGRSLGPGRSLGRVESTRLPVERLALPALGARSLVMRSCWPT